MATKTAQEVAKWPGSAALSDVIPDGWYARSTAAALIGRSKDTLKRWQREGTYEPSGYIVKGELTIWLYSDEDIEAMQDIAGSMKAGRPKKEE